MISIDVDTAGIFISARKGDQQRIEEIFKNEILCNELLLIPIFVFISRRFFVCFNIYCQ